MFLMQARVTVDGRRGEIPGAIQGHQIMAVEKHHGFKRLPTLELSKDERECRSQGLWRNGIEALPHPRVTGCTCNTINGLQIAFCPLFVKGEQGGGFEGKHGKCRHQRIIQGNLYVVSAIICDAGEVLVKQAEKRIGAKIFTSFWYHNGHYKPPLI